MAGQERWSGRTGFVLATIGSAIGLGSIWKFPYEAGANGGGAFLLVYIIGLIVLALPVMLAEFVIGRRGRGDAAESLTRLCALHAASPRWGLVGIAGIAAGFVILSYYSVIGGWTIVYALQALSLAPPAPDAAAARAAYEGMLADPARMALFHGVFIGLCALIVGAGVSAGIEATARILMPILLLLVTALALHGLIFGAGRAAVAFLFAVDLSRITPRAVADAIGLGFFSIGVGMGLMITYAAYAGTEIRLVEVAVIAILADTFVSLLAGLAIFSAVFQHGLDPASGAGLMFLTLPLAFARMPFGEWVALAFYVLLFVTALTSAVSLLELVVAYVRRRFHLARPKASAVTGLLIGTAGLVSVFSFNLLADVRPLAIFGAPAAGIFDTLDRLASDLMLPLAGLGVALFVGWVLPSALVAAELGLGRFWTVALRLVLGVLAPLLILAATLAPLF